MQQQDILIQELKKAIIATLGRTIDNPTDFDYLSIKIAEKTGDTISVSTLKRLFGYIKPLTAPRPSTLSSLARYVGYSGWSEFCQAQIAVEVSEGVEAKKPKKYRAIIIIVLILVIVGIATWYFLKSKPVEIPAPATINVVKIDTIKIVDTIFVQIPMAEAKPVVTKQQTNVDKYEAVLMNCIKKSNVMCNNLRSKRDGMDKHEYLNLVNERYAEFVFTELKNDINKQMAIAFADDEVLQQRYGNDVFIQCRDICVNILREAYQGIADAPVGAGGVDVVGDSTDL